MNRSGTSDSPRNHHYAPYVEPRFHLGLTSESEGPSPDSPLWLLGFQGGKEDPKRRNQGIINIALRLHTDRVYHTHFMHKNPYWYFFYIASIFNL